VKLEILGAESLGVRGLRCRVQVGERVIVIDPGVALGEHRFGLPPHPVQVAVGRRVRERIVEALAGATDVVFSHFHGDHVPLADANPYQLAIAQLPDSFASLRAWSLSPAGRTAVSQRRARDLMQRLGPNWHVAPGIDDGPLHFSPPVPHGLDARQRADASSMRHSRCAPAGTRLTRAAWRPPTTSRQMPARPLCVDGACP